MEVSINLFSSCNCLNMFILQYIHIFFIFQMLTMWQNASLVKYFTNHIQGKNCSFINKNLDLLEASRVITATWDNFFVMSRKFWYEKKRRIFLMQTFNHISLDNSNIGLIKYVCKIRNLIANSCHFHVLSGTWGEPPSSKVNYFLF